MLEPGAALPRQRVNIGEEIYTLDVTLHISHRDMQQGDVEWAGRRYQVTRAVGEDEWLAYGSERFGRLQLAPLDISRYIWTERAPDVQDSNHPDHIEWLRRGWLEQKRLLMLFENDLMAGLGLDHLRGVARRVFLDLAYAAADESVEDMINIGTVRPYARVAEQAAILAEFLRALPAGT